MLLTASAIAVDPTDNRIIYIGTGDFDFEGYLFFTTNGGSTWLPRTNIASDMWVREVKLSPDNPKRCYVDAQRTNSIVNPLTAGYYGIVARWINGVESGLSAISSGIEDELGNKIPIFGIDVDGKTDGIIYAATQNGVFKGIDYNYMQSPSIEVLSPPYGFNLDSFPMRVYGNYFLETVNKVTITGPSAQTEDLTIANGGIQSVSPTLIIVRVPAGLELGTWEAKVEVQRDAGTFTSDTATFEIIDQSSEGPQFKNVKFDGLSYVEEFAPMPVQRGPQVIARIEDPDGINDKGFSYVWINKATLGRREVTDEAEFDYDEISSTEGTVTFYVDPPFDPGSYDFIITAHDAATSEVLPDGNPNIWAGILEVEVGPVRVIGNILSYPTVFKPLKEGESTIAYNLSRSADVSVYIYDVAGQIVLTKKFASGLNGGRAGYNDFTWNGISDFGSYIGNGIYVIKITSGNKGIGTGKLVVFD